MLGFKLLRRILLRFQFQRRKLGFLIQRRILLQRWLVVQRRHRDL
jgi:hypothetical protein